MTVISGAGECRYTYKLCFMAESPYWQFIAYPSPLRCRLMQGSRTRRLQTDRLCSIHQDVDLQFLFMGKARVEAIAVTALVYSFRLFRTHNAVRSPGILLLMCTQIVTKAETCQKEWITRRFAHSILTEISDDRGPLSSYKYQPQAQVKFLMNPPSLRRLPESSTFKHQARPSQSWTYLPL